MSKPLDIIDEDQALTKEEQKQKEDIIKTLEQNGLEDIKVEKKKDYSKMDYKELYFNKTLRENIEGMDMTLKRKKDKIKTFNYELSIIRLMDDRSLNKLKLKIITARNKEDAEVKLYKSMLESYKKIKLYLDNKKDNKV